MLKLSIKNPTTQETETYNVVTEFNQFFDRAKEYGLINSIFSLKVKEYRSCDNGCCKMHYCATRFGSQQSPRRAFRCAYRGSSESYPHPRPRNGQTTR